MGVNPIGDVPLDGAWTILGLMIVATIVSLTLLIFILGGGDDE